MAVGPADLDACEVSFEAEAEVEAKIVGGVVAGAASDLVDPEPLRRFQGCARSDGIAVRIGADEVQAKPVVVILGEVDQEHGSIAEVVDDGFETAIIEKIGDGESSTGAGIG